MALFAVQIPKDDRIGGKLKVLEFEFLESLADLGILLTSSGDARQITLHIRHEYRHTDAAKTFRYYPKAYRLSSTGGTGNQTVTITHLLQDRVLHSSFSNAQPLTHEISLLPKKKIHTCPAN